MNPRSFHNGKVELWAGDCMEVLRELPADSIDAVVTDPPYHLTSIVKRFGKPGSAPVKIKLVEGQGGSPFARSARGFMGKVWDGGDIAFTPELWAEVLRVLKPGGHMVCFGGTRTYHRMACAIEDAGFEIRDQIMFAHETKSEIDAFTNSLNAEQRSQFGKLFCERGNGQLFWGFGSGFPKSHSISRNLNAERCMCSVQNGSEIQAPVSTGSVLQSQMRGNSEAHIADDKNLPDLRHVMDSIKPISSGEEQNLLPNLRSKEDSALQDRHNPQTSHRMRDVWPDGQRPTAIKETKAGESILQPLVSGQGSCRSPSAISGKWVGEKAAGNRNGRSDKPSVEGWGDLPKASGELCERPIRQVPARSNFDGKAGRIYNGASPSGGEAIWSPIDADGMCASSGPRPTKQRPSKSGTVALQQEPQERGTWDNCERCGKPIIPDGLGTALKPAHEPICLARKPLSEPTVAANCLRWGVGALNIDATRVAHDEPLTPMKAQKDGDLVFGQAGRRDDTTNLKANGRWPANLIHDGSPQVLAGFPDSDGCQPHQINSSNAKYDGWGSITNKNGEMVGYAGKGSAARYFYTAKADAEDRAGSRHPTVKPVDLIAWLVRLICPKNGTVLDPFAGTGTTGAATFREGCRAVLIEREAEYLADIERRMELLLSGPDERARKLAKADPHESLPLFGAV